MIEYIYNGVTTPLAADISAGATSMTVVSPAGFPAQPQFRFKIGSELIIATAVAGAVWTITRGAEGTTPAAHTAGDIVYGVATAGALMAVREQSVVDSSPIVHQLANPARQAFFSVAGYSASRTITLPDKSGTLAMLDDILAGGGTWGSITGAIAAQTDLVNYIASATAGLLDDRGNYDASLNVFPSTGGSGTAGAILKGDLWYISVGGTLGGTLVAIGDTIRAMVDTPGQTASNWSILKAGGSYTAAVMTTVGDMIYGTTLGVATRLPGNTTTNQLFLAQTGDGVFPSAPSWQPIPVAGFQVYYLHDTASDVGGYKKQLTAPYGTPATLTTAGVLDAQVLANFITDPGFPNKTSIPAGLYQLNLFAAQTAGTKATTLYAQIWETDAAGVDVALIGTTGNSATLTGSSVEQYITFALPSVYVMAGATSRIDVRVRASCPGAGTDPTVALYYGSTSASRTSLPSNAVDATNFVPYTGATANVNLGAFTLTAANVSGINTGDQTITLTGDVTGNGTGSFATIVSRVNGTALSGLATGLLKNTTGTGVPSIAIAGSDYSAGTSALATGILKSTTATGDLSIAVAGDFPTLNQSTTGNAATATLAASATALATARTISITGDLTYTSAAFDGSGNVTGAGTLAASGVTPGSYSNAILTIDAKGRVTGAASGGAGVATDFANDPATTTGLTYGYKAGVIRADNVPVAVAAGTVLLTASSVNYVEVTAGGAVSANVVGFTVGRFPMAAVTTDPTDITLLADSRGFAAIAGGSPFATDILVNGLTVGRGTTGNPGSTALGISALSSVTTGANNTALGASALYLGTTGSDNSAVGMNALYSNTTGYNNSAFGKSALYSNTTGYGNSAVGMNALYFNATGLNNSAFGLRALYTNTGSDNVAVGANAMYYNNVGSENTAIGTNALVTNTGGIRNTALGAYALYFNLVTSQNTAIGYYSLYTNVASGNTAVGFESLSLNTNGTRNAALGSGALRSNTTSSDNTAVGHDALRTNTTGANNAALGASAMYSATTGSDNSAVGSSALYSNTTGYNNSAVGKYALYSNTTGYGNSAVGKDALSFNTTGLSNSAFGASALYSNTTGAENVAVGFGALYLNATGANNTAVGFNAGYALTGTGNVMVGYSAGSGLTAVSNKLVVSNTSTATPLVSGNFDPAGGALGDLTINAAFFAVTGRLRTGGYTVATLPAGVVGDRAYVTDALTPTYGAAAVGGGAVTVPVFYNGAAWVTA